MDYQLFESLQEVYQQNPPKHFELPEGLLGGPIRGHAQGGEYVLLVPLTL